MIAGAAFHWYSGDHFEALDLCRTRYPDKKLIVSESCIEYYKYDVSDACGAAQALSHELIGDLNHGISAFLDWNLLLDQHGGPNYVGNYCLAPFFYDTDKKTLKPHLISQYFSHFARAIPPGSVRVASTTFSGDAEATAWRQKNGTLSDVLFNRSSSPCPICVRLHGQEASLLLFPRSIASFTVT